MENYDSTADTLKHIKRVSELLNMAAIELIKRGNVHDNSKLEEPEKALFDVETYNLGKIKFGSDEYGESLARLQPALDHHYANNAHHPQHYANGIGGMNLFDIIEMFLDWKAATERSKNGNITSSIDYNKDRFEMSSQLANIFENTVSYLGWDGE